MSHHIAVRDAARIVLPFSIFIGLFGHGAVAAASLALGAICLWVELGGGLRPAPATTDVERG